MSIKEKALQLYLEEDCNCAEAIILAANPDCDAQLAHAMGAFGGGMGCGKACGALCSSIATLGLLTISGTAHENPETRELAAAYTREFEKIFGAIDCASIKAKYFKKGVRCAELVGNAAELLEQYIKQIHEQ